MIHRKPDHEITTCVHAKLLTINNQGTPKNWILGHVAQLVEQLTLNQ